MVLDVIVDPRNNATKPSTDSFTEGKEEENFRSKKRYRKTAGYHISYPFKHHKKYKNMSIFGSG